MQSIHSHGVGAKVAEFFSVPEDDLCFEEDAFFAQSNSCIVEVRGERFDVWFDEALNILGAVKAV